MTENHNQKYAQEKPEEIVLPEDQLPPAVLDTLPDHLKEALKRMGWSNLSPIQSYALPYMLDERDLIAQARTGSGKTGAFLLPILDRVDASHPYCQALVLVPTRELAVQVHKEAENLMAGSGIRAAAIYGGVGYGAQREALRNGSHLVIGTPGRILDHIINKTLDIEDLEILVLDEADRMLSMGFYPDMRQIRKYLPKNRNSYMFSATFPVHVANLAQEFLYKPDFLSLSYGNVHITGMDHNYYEVPAMDKDRCLIKIIEQENPPAAIIFCNTKQKVNYIATVLQRFGYDADQLTADLSQRDREGVLDRIRSKKLRFLVATDVAARGIDISHLTHVFLYEIPEDPESYIHRAGRTGRAGAAGICITLASYSELPELQRVAARYSINMERKELPTDEDINTLVSERTIAALEQSLRAKDSIELERMKRFLPLAKTLSENTDELQLIAMLLDKLYHETLHAVPEQPVDESVVKTEKKAGNRPRAGRRGGNGGGRRSRPKPKN